MTSFPIRTLKKWRISCAGKSTLYLSKELCQSSVSSVRGLLYYIKLYESQYLRVIADWSRLDDKTGERTLTGILTILLSQLFTNVYVRTYVANK